MKQLTEVIKELEREKQKDLARTFTIEGRDAFVVTPYLMDTMADLFQQCFKRNLEMITMPQIARARADADLNSEQGKLLWKYNWMTQSALSRMYFKGKEYAAFTINNPFSKLVYNKRQGGHNFLIPDDYKRKEMYERRSVSGGIPLKAAECQEIYKLKDGTNVIIVPYLELIQSDRGVVSITDILSPTMSSSGLHPVVLGAFGNDKKLVQDYLTKYIEVMKKSPFTPLEIGVWFSKDDAPNTMRPLEIGDSGIGIYNRNLNNTGYRTIGVKK